MLPPIHVDSGNLLTSSFGSVISHLLLTTIIKLLSYGLCNEGRHDNRDCDIPSTMSPTTPNKFPVVLLILLILGGRELLACLLDTIPYINIVLKLVRQALPRQGRQGVHGHTVNKIIKNIEQGRVILVDVVLRRWGYGHLECVFVTLLMFVPYLDQVFKVLRQALPRQGRQGIHGHCIENVFLNVERILAVLVGVALCCWGCGHLECVLVTLLMFIPYLKKVFKVLRQDIPRQGRQDTHGCAQVEIPTFKPLCKHKLRIMR